MSNTLGFLATVSGFHVGKGGMVMLQCKMGRGSQVQLKLTREGAMDLLKGEIVVGATFVVNVMSVRLAGVMAESIQVDDHS